MFTPFFLIFSFFLVFSSIISISSSTWLGAWLGLEVNLMSFIPLVLLFGVSNSEGMLKYFLVQAFSSILFLMSIIGILYREDVLYFSGHDSYLVFMMVPLMIKLGSAPFHFWFPAVSSSLDWLSNFVLMTWQKLAPLILLGYIIQFGVFSLSVIVLSSVIGSVGGLNQTSLRKLMAYSSINHLSWMLVSSLYGVSLVLCYFLIYAVTNFIILFMFYKMNLYFLSQLSYLNSNFVTTLLFINLFSFGGLPPFLGFMPKWFVLDAMMNNSFELLALIMVLFSLISLFYYMRLGYVVYSQSGLINLVNNIVFNWNFFMIFLSSVSLVGLILLPVFMILI